MGVSAQTVTLQGLARGQLQRAVDPEGLALSADNDVRGAAANAISERTAIIIAGVFVIVASLFAFYAQNRPKNVTFLVDTDSEMKKVNWTTKQELIGSTKVVIGFMFILSMMLFLVDIFFGYLFYFLGVLKFSPGLFERFFN